jgi:hypothetical protein
MFIELSIDTWFASLAGNLAMSLMPTVGSIVLDAIVYVEDESDDPLAFMVAEKFVGSKLELYRAPELERIALCALHSLFRRVRGEDHVINHHAGYAGSSLEKSS